MAIINSELGSARRKIGNTVYYRRDGKTVARRAAENVSNPQTKKQMAQRVIFATAVRSRDALKSIVNHSFENKKYGSQSLSFFMKRALQTLRNRAAADKGNFNCKDIMSMQANPLLISSGSLRSLNCENDGAGIDIGGDVINEKMTVGGFLNRHPEIQKGDQLTFLFLQADTSKVEGYTASGEAYNPTYLIKARVTIPADIADDAVFFDLAGIGFGPLLITEGVNNVILDEAGNSFIVKVDDSLAAAVIVSRPEGKKWLRSTEYLTLNTKGDPDLYYFSSVLNTWLAGATKITGVEDDEYLNQGEEQSVENRYGLTKETISLMNSSNGAVTNVQNVACVRIEMSNGSVQNVPIVKTPGVQSANPVTQFFTIDLTTNTLTALAYTTPKSFVSPTYEVEEAERLTGKDLTIAE